MDQLQRRSLHWERGLKWLVDGIPAYPQKSLPSLGAWIEIPDDAIRLVLAASLPSLGAWIEMLSMA